MKVTTPALADLANTDFVQLLFTDVAGRLKSLEIPSARWGVVRGSGRPLDGSVLLGRPDPDHDELRLVPDASTFVLRPWRTPSGRSVGMVFCDVIDREGQPFAADPRAVLRRAVQQSTTRGQQPSFGVEAEFYLLRSDGTGAATTPCNDGGNHWDSGEDEHTDEVCRDISEALDLMGFTVTGHHHELRTGQRKITFEQGNALSTADRLLLLKHTAHAMARRRSMSVVFVPGPHAGLQSNALRVHASLIGTGADARPLFHDSSDPLGMSRLFGESLAGVLEHAPALSALSNPTVDAYQRLVPVGTPMPRAWARHDDSTAFKVSGDPGAPATMRLEMRGPGPAANPYLLFTGILAAFADGQDRALRLPKPYIAPRSTTAASGLAAHGHAPLPADLPTALRSLEGDSTLRTALGELLTRAVVLAGRTGLEAWHRLATFPRPDHQSA